MKSASAALIAFLADNTNLLMADLWTITCRNGQVLRYTSADINITRLDTFTRNSVATYYDNTGTLQTADANVPRYGYNPASTLTPKEPIGLILEPFATNLVDYSQDLTNWTPNNAPTIIANAAIGPDGTMSASTVSSNATSGGCYQFSNIDASTNYTMTYFIKWISGASDIRIGDDYEVPETFVNNYITIDCKTGIVSSVGAGIISYEITLLPNSWFKVAIQFRTDAAQSQASMIVYRNSSVLGVIAIWGVQLESGLGSTSSIYTSGEPANRSADSFSGTIFAARDVLVTGGQLQNTRGLTVNESDVTCVPSPTSVVGGVPFLQAAANGIFDRATVQRERVFMPQWGDTSLGSVIVFLGEITDITPTRTNAVFKCKDLTNLLNIQMPLRQFQPNCSWTFGDSSCTINRTAFEVTGAITAGTTAQNINCNVSAATGFYNQGVIRFTSGLNSGLSKTVKSWTTGQAVLVANMPSIPQVGDTFTLTPGCDKTQSTCQNTYNNLIHFGGEPFVPTPETAH